MKTKKIIVGILILIAIIICATISKAIMFMYEIRGEKSVIAVGEQLELKAIMFIFNDIYYQDGPDSTERDITDSCEWTSSNPNIATVNNNGVVTGVAQGDVTINVKISETESMTYKLTVVPEGQEAIQFEDENLYNAIVEALGNKISSKDDENYKINITKENIDSITSLELQEKQIGKLAGLGRFTNLKELNLSSNSISNIDEISYLTKLEKLNLFNNKITLIGVNTFKGLTNLQ